jgi:hypothetical protein
VMASGFSLRQWCPEERPVAEQLPMIANSPAPYAPWETAAATRVTFLLHHAGIGPKKTTAAPVLLLANESRYSVHISPDCPRYELWTDGSVAVGKSGAAAIIRYITQDGTSTVIASASVACGGHACSFTAGIRAIELGLQLFSDLQDSTAEAPLWVISDSLSSLQALARGPCNQQDFGPRACWGLLLPIAYHLCAYHGR